MLKQIYDFLFFMPQIAESNRQELLLHPKCKRKLTRKRAFAFLIEACNNNEDNFLQLLDPIVKNHEQFDQNDMDSVNVSVKGAHGFVGLRNLGCTCYINSLL